MDNQLNQPSNPPLDYKDVTIDGKNFRITQLSARQGDWIVTQMGLGTYAKFDTFTQVQNMLLSVCQLYIDAPGGQIPAKLFEDGRWLLKQAESFEYNLDIVNGLSQAALEFNVGPFLEKRIPKPRASQD